MTTKKQAAGISLLAFVWLIAGFIFISADNTAIGAAMFSIAVVFIAAGAAAARKAASAEASTGGNAAPPTEDPARGHDS